jgi:predicted phosphate transport protein (TIGR00153 family)
MMLFKKEKEVRRLVLEHLSLTRDCLAETRNVLEHYLAGDLDPAIMLAEKVKRLEREGDHIKRQARVMLHNGAFLPQVRADIHHLVELVDKINNCCETSAKCLVHEQPKIPQEFASDLMEICNQGLSCYHELRSGMKNFIKPEGEIEALHAHVEQVYKLQSEIHIKQAELTGRIFNSTQQLAEKIHLGQLLRVISAVADLSEDVADALESVVMRSVV